VSLYSLQPWRLFCLSCIKQDATSRWATGLLFDGVTGGLLSVANRHGSGSGHGWAGASVVYWNAVASDENNAYHRAARLKVEAAPTTLSWAVGAIGNVDVGGNGRSIWESYGRPVEPRSLYLAQRTARAASTLPSTSPSTSPSASPHGKTKKTKTKKIKSSKTKGKEGANPFDDRTLNNNTPHHATGLHIILNHTTHTPQHIAPQTQHPTQHHTTQHITTQHRTGQHKQKSSFK